MTVRITNGIRLYHASFPRTRESIFGQNGSDAKAKWVPAFAGMTVMRGNPLGQPLVGLMTVDFYGAYLEEAISAATTRLRGSSESKS